MLNTRSCTIEQQKRKEMTPQYSEECWNKDRWCTPPQGDWDWDGERLPTKG